jgi:DNA-binding response OmpR family regulator
VTGPEVQLSSAPAAVAPTDGPGNILIVDDEVFVRNAFQLYFETLRFHVQVAECGERALEIFSAPAVPLDAAILDLVMPGMQGIEVLKAFKRKDPTVEVIIATGCGSMSTAIEALRFGAFDYLTKPIIHFDQDLLTVVQEAVRTRREKSVPARIDPAAAPPSEATKGERGRLQALEHLVEIAGIANQFRPNLQTLEPVEQVLLRHFGASAGAVLARSAPGDLVPLHSWGFSSPLVPRAGGVPHNELGHAIRQNVLGVFSLRDLDTRWLGVPPEDLASFAHVASLPLVPQGNPWGAVLLFFPQPLAEHLIGPLETHVFQVLSSILATVFSGALKIPRSSAGG